MTVQLIIDAESVAEAHGVSFHLNRAIKHPENPVLGPGRPEDWDGLQVAWPGSIIRDPSTGMFKLWYMGMDAVQSPGRKWNPGYAESPDGIHWTKPPLGQVDQDGRPTNRLGGEGVYTLSSVLLNPDPSDERRFVSLYVEPVDPANNIYRKRLGFSTDGITWDWAGPVAWAGFLPPKRAVYDITQLLHDPDDPDPSRRIKAYAQGQFWPSSDGTGAVVPDRFEAGRRTIRCVGVLTGASLATLEEGPLSLALAPQAGIDDETHFGAARRFGDTFVLLFESDRFAVDPLDGDLRVAVSSDGLTFRRVHPDHALVDTGPKGTWDQNLLVTTTAGMIDVGDEHWIYYFGCPDVYRAWPPGYAIRPELRGSFFYPSYLGLAVIQRDRIAYAAGPGTVVTHAMGIGPDGLWLNADGDIESIELVADGEVIASGALGSERRSTVYRPITWTTAPGVVQAQLRIRIGRDGRLYSLLA